MNRGYTLIEALVVVAIAGIIMAVAAYSYVPTMRSNRAKKAIQDIKTTFADAKVTAARENRDVNIVDNGNGLIDVFLDRNGNNTLDIGTDQHMYQVVVTGITVNPGRPEGITGDYYFEEYVQLSPTTRTGVAFLDRGAIGYVGDTIHSQIPFLTGFRIQVRPNGFFRIFDSGGNEIPFGAMLCMHTHDIRDNDITPDRHYVLAFAVTGWMQTYRLDRDNFWVTY